MEKMAVLRLPCPCGTGDQIKSALQYVPQLFAALPNSFRTPGGDALPAARNKTSLTFLIHHQNRKMVMKRFMEVSIQHECSYILLAAPSYTKTFPLPPPPQWIDTGAEVRNKRGRSLLLHIIRPAFPAGNTPTAPIVAAL